MRLALDDVDPGGLGLADFDEDAAVTAVGGTQRGLDGAAGGVEGDELDEEGVGERGKGETDSLPGKEKEWSVRVSQRV